MSAAWLMDNAQFYEQPVFRKAHLEFGEGSLMDGRLLKVELAAPRRLSSEVTYLVIITFYMSNLTRDSDFYVALCDGSVCAGYQYNDDSAIRVHEWSALSKTCVNNRRWSEWRNKNAHFWELRYELTPKYSLGITFSPSVDRALSHVYDAVLNPHNGLWITVCRNNANEQYEFHYLETAVQEDTFVV
ncbi:uncharacterized protein LOC134193983 [Corticium candelabrum]|uniref:uncharacterized protein LOC134193983 n=1 Tax=Corticium candelabrum TaxID=121492 RepID=UPI002E26A64E|nr:uncharacterized protein LOC134193983 [Corticium candelabrum]